MITYLLIGLILGLLCATITAVVFKRHVTTVFAGLEIAPADVQPAVIAIFIITAILFLILWKLMLFIWLLVMGLFYIYKKFIM